MAERDSLLVDLERAIERGSQDRRTETLRRVTDLFVGRADALNDEHIRLFDDVILRLAAEIETRARAELGRRLASIDNAPLEVIRDLARDDEITVAAPVLVRSKRLAPADLVDIARTKSQAHLLAISNRSALDEVVTDVLVDRGDGDVLFNVAGNSGANFSADGFATLVNRAGIDEALASRVVARPDIPPPILRKLVMQANEVVRRRLVAVVPAERRSELQQVITKVSNELSPDLPATRNFTAAQRMMRMLHEAGTLDESELYDLAKSRRYEETVAAISILCAVPIDVVDWLMNGDRIEPLLILFKASGYDWLTARAVVQARPSGKKLSAKELEEFCDDFNRLSYATARQVIKHWQSRDGQKIAV